MNIDNFMENGIINSYKLIVGESTLEDILDESSMQPGCISQHNPPIFFIEPEAEYNNEDLDTMIDYSEELEEYEKCAILIKLKK